MGHGLEDVVPPGAPPDAVVHLELDAVAVPDLGVVFGRGQAHGRVSLVRLGAVGLSVGERVVVDGLGLGLDLDDPAADSHGAEELAPLFAGAGVESHRDVNVVEDVVGVWHLLVNSSITLS